jgi:hypothetical protein
MSPGHAVQLQCGSYWLAIGLLGLHPRASDLLEPLPYFSTTFDDKLQHDAHIALEHCGGHRFTTDETTTRIAIKCLSSSWN